MTEIHKIEAKRFFRFSLVGISGAIVDFFIFNLLTKFGVEPILSSVCSFIIAVGNNFHWNRNWTYPESKNLKTSIQLIQFFLVSMIGLLIRTPLFAYLQEPVAVIITDLGFSLSFVSLEIAADNISLASVIIIVLFWNFFANRLWTYREI